MSAPTRPSAPALMGILNVTPDSFSDGGRYDDPERALSHARALIAAGADIIDLGGESTRPGAARVTAEEEQARVVPVLRALAGGDTALSIDTMRAATAAAAVAAGATIINDVSGGLADPAMLDTAAESGADLILGHWRGHSDTMAEAARYADPVAEVAAELRARADAARAAGVDDARILLDPGLGFAKDAAHNWAILAGLPTLVALGYPVLVGASRKRFLAPFGTGPEPADRSVATAVVDVLAVQAGAWGVRSHDVAASRSALGVLGAWQSVRRD